MSVQLSLSPVLGRRFVRALTIFAALFIIYIEGATAFLNTQKALEAKAVAANALLRQNAEGVVAEQRAKTQLEIARNAAERQKAEAEKAEAEALKAESEAVTVRNAAINARLNKMADAETIKNEAELRKQKLVVAVETARNAARLQAAEADKIEARVSIKRQANASIKHHLEVTDCSRRYSGSGHFADDFLDVMSRRASCRN
jgi:Spy/CpxP family protein refolding chaperone